jgi:hypothetical protein
MTKCFTRGRTGASLTGLPFGVPPDALRSLLSQEVELGSVALHDSPWEVGNVSCGQPLSGQLRSAFESPSGMESTTEPKLHVRSHNTITMEALALDNALNWCHHHNRKGGLEVTMSGSILATRCSGRRPTAGVPRDSISPNGSSFARTPAAFRQPLSNSEASLRHASFPNQSVGETGGSDDTRDHETFLIQKVLRFWQKGRSSSPQLVRISSDFLSGNSLAAKGDALIHRLRMVARPVGSEWRTRRPFQVTIQTNLKKGDRTR